MNTKCVVEVGLNLPIRPKEDIKLKTVKRKSKYPFYTDKHILQYRFKTHCGTPYWTLFSVNVTPFRQQQAVSIDRH